MGIVSLKDYRWDGSKKLELKDAETGAPEFVDKKTLKAQTLENLAEAAALQDKLYAQGREGSLIAIQARDAAGKDSLIKKVFGQLNPAALDAFPCPFVLFPSLFSFPFALLLIQSIAPFEALPRVAYVRAWR